MLMVIVLVIPSLPHHIDVGDTRPVHQQLRQQPDHVNDVIDDVKDRCD